jgi:hypothetical protein
MVTNNHYHYNRRRPSFLGFLGHIVATILTGGLWLVGMGIYALYKYISK